MTSISSAAFHGRNLLWRLSRSLGNERANYPQNLAVDGPNEETVAFIKRCGARHIAEIGIYKGHTSLAIADVLNGQGELHLYDYFDKAETVAAEINRRGHQNVETFGCSYKIMDSYNWSLAKVIEKNDGPIYDYVFLDGAHTFAVDALTFYLADQLLKVGGHFDFDDYGWTLDGSPSMNPKRFPLTAKLYTQEQIEARGVKMVIDLCVRHTGRYEEIVPNKIFRKTS